MRSEAIAEKIMTNSLHVTPAKLVPGESGERESIKQRPGLLPDYFVKLHQSKIKNPKSKM